MKRLISVSALLLTVAFTAGILMAQETKTDPPDGPKGYKSPLRRSLDTTRAVRTARTKRPNSRNSQRPVRPGTKRAMPQRPNTTRPMMMQQQQIKGLQVQLARKRQAFMEYSGELKAIRKIALQEDAKKTVEHIDKLIASKEKEFEKSTKGTADRIKKVRAQIEKQTKDQAERNKKKRSPRPAPPKPKDTDTKDTGEKKDK